MSQQTQKLFEGPDVHVLLDEIRSEYGYDATITKAETVRDGGILGFFQKERYRLSVDESTPTAPLGRVTSTVDLSAARPLARAAARAAASPPPADAPTSGRPAPATLGEALGSPAFQPPALDAPLLGADLWAALVDDTVDANLVATGSASLAGPAPATPGEAMGGMAASAVPEVAAVAPSTPVAAPEAIATALPTPPADPTDEERRALAGRSAEPAPAEPAVISFESVLERVAAAVELQVANPALAVPTTQTSPAPSMIDIEATPMIETPATEQSEAPANYDSEGPVNDESHAQTNHNPEVPSNGQSTPSGNGNGSEIPAPRMAESAAGHTGARGGWGSTAGRTAPARPTTTTPSASSETLARSLKRRGLNAQMVEQVVAEADAGRDVATALTEALSALPTAPPLPSETGALIVVAGPLADSVEIATEIAGSVGTLASDVLVASAGPYLASIDPERRVRSAKKAAQRGPAARFGSVGVVAVDIPVGSNSTQWAHEVIGALHPTAVVGIVDAVDKADDIEDWADAIGGVDSLIVTNPASSRSPATVLDVPIPVSRLGTVRATAASWAAIILDRLS